MMRPELRRKLLEPPGRRARLVIVTIGLAYALLGAGAVIADAVFTRSLKSAAVVLIVVVGVLMLAAVVSLVLWILAVRSRGDEEGQPAGFAYRRDGRGAARGTASSSRYLVVFFAAAFVMIGAGIGTVVTDVSGHRSLMTANVFLVLTVLAAAVMVWVARIARRNAKK